MTGRQCMHVNALHLLMFSRPYLVRWRLCHHVASVVCLFVCRLYRMYCG